MSSARIRFQLAFALEKSKTQLALRNIQNPNTQIQGGAKISIFKEALTL
jgi:hypothetical protein